MLDWVRLVGAVANQKLIDFVVGFGQTCIG